MAVDILITLTTIGADQGTTLDIFSDVDGYAVAYDTATSAQLLSGYTTSAPDGTNSVRVCGQDPKCVNCVDIVPIYTTTTSTTLSGLEQAGISLYTDVADACGITIDTVCWIDTQVAGVLTAGDVIYDDAGGLITYYGKGNYHHIVIDSVPATTYSAKVDNVGSVLATVDTCP